MVNSKKCFKKVWSEKNNYQNIDTTKKKNKVKNSFFNESKIKFIERIPEIENFSFLNVMSNLKERLFRKCEQVNLVTKLSKSIKLTRKTRETNFSRVYQKSI